MLPPRDIPPKPRPPEAPALARGRLPKTPVEALLVLELELELELAAGAAVVTGTEEVEGGSAGFPSAGGPPKLKPEEARGSLAG